MITSVTSHSHRLTGEARLLLDLPSGASGGYHAFSEVQLVACVLARDAQAVAQIQQFGVPDGKLYGHDAYRFPLGGSDKRAAFLDAVEWLEYRRLCVSSSVLVAPTVPVL